MPRAEPVTALYGVAGWPLEFTLSPRLHNGAFTALGIRAAYLPLRVRPEHSTRLLDSLETLGFRGANVTVPHKETAFRLCGRLSPEARAARSVNTLTRTPRGWAGHTTDGVGLARFLRSVGVAADGSRIALLGAGGASRSVAQNLLGRDGVRLTLVSRDARTASRSLAGLGRPGKGSSLSIVERGSRDAQVAVRAARVVLNGTTLGSAPGGAMPCPVDWVRPDAVAVDFVYGRETPWVRALRRRHVTAWSGLGMLIHQAALAFEVWTGRDALPWMLWAGGWDVEKERVAGLEAPAPGPGRPRV